MAENRIKQLREERRMSLEDVARLCNCSRMAILKLERGERKLTTDWAEKLSNAFRVKVGEILYENDNPNSDVSSFLSPAEIDLLLNEHGATQVDLAKYLDMSPQSAHQLISGNRRITVEEALRIKEFFEVFPNRLTSNGFGNRINPRPALIPVYAMALQNKKGVFKILRDALSHVERPIELKDVHDAFALYVETDVMEPRYLPGETIYIHPTRPVKDGDFVIVEFNDGTAIMRRLLRGGLDSVTVEQYKPARKEKLKRSSISKIYQIVLGG